MSVTALGVMKLIAFNVYEFVVMSVLPVSLGNKDDSWFEFTDGKLDITDFLGNSLCTVPMAHCEGYVVLFVVGVSWWRFYC